MNLSKELEQFRSTVKNHYILLFFIMFVVVVLFELRYAAIGNQVYPYIERYVIAKKDFTKYETHFDGLTDPLLGSLEKERIPEDLDLGDYWYWLYLEEPIVVYAATPSGKATINKIELRFDDNKLSDVERFLGKRVLVDGELSWGYAESRIVLVQEITLVRD